MIDTVSILIDRDNVVITSTSKTGGPTWDLQSKTKNYEKFVRNPSKGDLEKGIYLPRLTGYRMSTSDNKVKIEFSIPKLLYLNNLDEVEDKDFGEVIDTLIVRLELMGVFIKKRFLVEAHVSSVHFSKNIVLEDGYNSQYIISEINKIDLSKSFDFTRSRFTNNGEVLYAHTDYHQLTLYDKVADLNKSSKKSMDKNQSPYQKSLFSVIKERDVPLEILRFETRLSRQKMLKFLEILGSSKPYTFEKIFSSQLSKKVIKYYWEIIIKEGSKGIFHIPSTENKLRNLILKYPEMKPKQAIYLIGLSLLSREIGLRNLRMILSKNSVDRTWFRKTEDLINMVNESGSESVQRSWVVQIDNKLNNFEALRYFNGKESTIIKP